VPLTAHPAAARSTGRRRRATGGASGCTSAQADAADRRKVGAAITRMLKAWAKQR